MADTTTTTSTCETAQTEGLVELKELIQGAVSIDPDVNIQELLKLAKNTDELKRVFQADKAIKVLILGKSGVGKSTLINGLIGREVAEVHLGLSTQGVSLKVEPFNKEIETMDVMVFDSPGLQHGSGNEQQYLEVLYDKCKDVDLVIFAIRMSNNRFVLGDSDSKAMVKFTQKFGHSVWNKTLVVVTFADQAESLNPQLESMEQEQKKDFFKKLMSDYETVVHDSLEKEAHVPRDVIKKVKVIPTGREGVAKLLDGTLWFTRFWLECLASMSTLEARASMIKVNAARLRTSTSVVQQDFDRILAEQPIVLSLTEGTVAIPACVSEIVANLVELTGIPIGVFFGMTVGGMVAAAKSSTKD